LSKDYIVNMWFDAVETGDLSLVKKLLLENSNLLHSLSQDKETAIIKASENGHAQVLLFLLLSGANPNDTDLTILHQSPLILASHQGHTDVINILLDAGVNMEYQNSLGETALITAAQEGQINAVRLLLLSGADPSRTNSNGDSPLSLASSLLRGDRKTAVCHLLRI